MAKQSVPGSYKGGVEKWKQDYTRVFARWEKSLAEALARGAPETPLRFHAISECQLMLGLFHTWAGDGEQAREYFRACSENVLAGVQRTLPDLTSSRAPGYARISRDGAAAAALAGEGQRSRTLFSYAEQFAAALVTGEEERPGFLDASVDVNGIDPLVRAYSLIRLGRLSGFHALRFLDPPAEPDDSIDVWGPQLWGPIAWEPMDVHGLLDTAEICWRLGKPWRGEDFRSEKGLFPLLRAITSSLEAPDSEAERAAAQQALLKYYRTIRDMGDFGTIYLLVLDLQNAFPQIFTPVVPTVL